MQRFSALFIIIGLVFSGCGKDDDSSTTETAEFAESMPDMEMLTLSTDDTTATAGGLMLTEAPLVGEPAAIQNHNKQVMVKLNQLMQWARDEAEKTFAGSTPQVIDVSGVTCAVWEGDREKNHWKLEACRIDAAAKLYSFKVQGRPLESTSDDDYLTIIAGKGARLPAFENKRRGRGQIGFNFDNLATLTGRDVAGKLGIGYRIAGRVRQMVLGLRDLRGPDETVAHSAIYRFLRVKGVGGRFSFFTVHDFLTTDSDDKLILGTDGVEEKGRVAIVWTAAKEGRTAWAACGGTVGEGSCIRVVQCWQAEGDVTFEEYATDVNAEITWSKTECPDVPLPLEGPPPESDETLPAADPDSDAPLMTEPASSDLES